MYEFTRTVFKKDLEFLFLFADLICGLPVSQWIRFLKSGYLIADFGSLASNSSQRFYPLHFSSLETNLKSGNMQTDINTK